MTLNSLEVTKCQKLIYSIFVFLSPKFYNIYVFIFRIIFARTSYAATVDFMTLNIL
jgi:hypothetical protein